MTLIQLEQVFNIIHSIGSQDEQPDAKVLLADAVQLVADESTIDHPWSDAIGTLDLMLPTAQNWKRIQELCLQASGEFLDWKATRHLAKTSG